MDGSTRPDPAAAPVRQHAWPSDGPAELELTVDVGRVSVRLGDDVAEVRVEVRHDPSASTPFTQGISGILGWLGAGPDGPTAEDTAAAAVRDAEITWSEGARLLVVRSSEDLTLRTLPLAVTVTAPAGSRLTARTGAGDITVDGRAGRAAVRTGSGNVRLGPVAGEVDVTTGSGRVDLGPLDARAQVRTGSGAVRLAATAGPTEVKAGSGDVTVGTVAADLGVRSGSGDVTVDDARAGRIAVIAGSGSVRIGVHPGVAAELDLSSGSGRAHSELEIGAVAPAGGAPLHLRGRTGSGDVLVTRAAVPARG
ncbi:MAG TPA: DUF4097 family beta strand repeat-containing protein [Pseudonocardia sp.]|jgi:hypothetical protein|nr:DUF4097 family beta strand repeat-containing protein [Pseudonocardia sp.]